MPVQTPIYLDNHSTTKTDPRVVEAMLPYFSENYGNAATRHHAFGWKAEAAVENARRQVAKLIGAQGNEIVLTSGATESVNLALKGVAEAYSSKGHHIITAATEHKAVLDTCKRLERYGFSVTCVPVDKSGIVNPEQIRKAITDHTILVTVMMANNEIGTIAPIAEIGSACREAGILFHTDATQAVGKIPVKVDDLNADLISFSGHKMYGPKGIGALYVRMSQPRINIASQIDGGGHERGLRSGTLNVPAIVGFGKAAAIAGDELMAEMSRTSSLRDSLENALVSLIDDSEVNGDRTMRLPHNLNVTFRGIDAERLIMEMKDIAVSTGSACSSATAEPSHVLRAIGLSDRDVRSSIRFGLGRFTTREEIEYTINRVVQSVQVLRGKEMQFAHS